VVDVFGGAEGSKGYDVADVEGGLGVVD